MMDNKEAGSRDTASARQDTTPATTATAVSSSQRDHANIALTAASAEEARPGSADMQQFIGRQLRAVYDDVAKQPIPDRFLELMKQLDAKSGGR